ncbi:hypothetical protein QBC36DRAFT_321251 [Triangularia setosa]|uniref:Secreted protein n=1 Tax=Triangularia setosa TaxID=2587417 RepID=A0AAN7AAE5_9PEZI|nr:hypothetical protein QBC36DRAFT_321251 [Podospora setosa]
MQALLMMMVIHVILWLTVARRRDDRKRTKTITSSRYQTNPHSLIPPRIEMIHCLGVQSKYHSPTVTMVECAVLIENVRNSSPSGLPNMTQTRYNLLASTS